MTDEARMRRERWQRIEQIYRQALDRDGPARVALLDDACAGDAALRQEVDSLLACEPNAAGFIETPALDVAADTLTREPVANLVGRRIGPYVIEVWLGSGGMGDVYRARDTNLHREVALKILPGPFALDPERLARFRREARVLASLNHPNIAAIYGFEESSAPADSGQAAVHALALELVDGPTLGPGEAGRPHRDSGSGSKPRGHLQRRDRIQGRRRVRFDPAPRRCGGKVGLN